MAKKKETTSLIEALLEYQELKSIDRNTLIAVMEDSLRNVLSKMFGSDDTFDVIINARRRVTSRSGARVTSSPMRTSSMRCVRCP